MSDSVKSVITIVQNETIMGEWGTYPTNILYRRKTYHMHVFNMAYAGTSESDRMPFPSRPGLQRVYRILGI